MSLPNLVYIGDVPVESSYHGSALLYRLLQNYPPERLRIIEGNLRCSLPERRLRGVEYRRMRVGRQRWLNTRFHSWVSSWLTRTAKLRARQLPILLKDFAPEAVLTVTHEYSWITAAAYAARCGLPLQLVVHDDWPRIAHLPPPFDEWLDSQFGRVYRQARSRFCVSSFMCGDYEVRYGIGGTVLYPSRAADCPTFEAPPERLLQNDRAFTMAFGGTINSASVVRTLAALASTLEPEGGRLLIFGPLTPEAARRAGLERANIVLRGLVKSSELMARLREEADALIVPMSFDAPDRANMEISFPSKLTDYTAVGLPILIHGPPYCSAVRWASEYTGLAETVTKESVEALSDALVRLKDPEYRSTLARRAIEVGNALFCQSAAEAIFFKHVCRPRTPSRN